MGTHRNRAPVGRIALLGFIALAVLLAALAFRPLSLQTAHAQANSPPQFASEATDRAVDENTLPFAGIGAPITATDPDSDTLTYSLENAGVSHFGIDSATGQLLVGSPLDHEMTDSYPVKVIATDPSGAKDTIDMTITVNDVDEPGTVSLSWKQPQVDAELDAALADPDGDVSGLTWQWSWSNTKNGNYSNIDGATSTSYTPVTGDVGKYLRATASYTDGEGSGKTAQMVSYRLVRAEPSNNGTPAFPARRTSAAVTLAPAVSPIEVSAFASRGASRSAPKFTNRRGPRTRTVTRSAIHWKGLLLRSSISRR